MISRILFLSILHLLTSFMLPSSALAETRSHTKTILVYGDSLSAAYGIPREQGWVSLLEKRIAEQRLPYRIVNASVSGETTSGGLSRFPANLKQHKPDLIILELGANDGLRGLSVNDMQRNLGNMIQAARDAKAEVLLLGMMMPPNYGHRYAQDFKASYTQLALKFKLPLVPFFLDGVAGNPELVLDDGVHPTSAGQPRILENIWTELGPLLTRKR
jgi:acyl-CoA thioesterase-1